MPRSRVRSMLAAAIVGAVLLATLGGSSSASAARTISAVYTLSNAPTGNAVLVWQRASDGTLTSAGSYPTGGLGTGAGMIVSEANGAPGGSAASSYRLDDDELELVSASVPTTQTAACWVVVTRNGRYAYTANAGSGSISGFRIARDGTLTLLNADGRTGVTGDGSGPTDMALSHNSQFLYVRNGRNNTIGAFAVAGDGSLQPIAGAAGLPAGTAGLAAW